MTTEVEHIEQSMSRQSEHKLNNFFQHFSEQMDNKKKT